ncbi:MULTISPECIES: class I SAM-dependent methyltransferase [unclassified Fredinandcohnia]|uniref:class I SAM-dependent methyltransferase n=1 Tax=unclassified Fredinandcohnia TaxID=2837514 RepID=UPI0030FD2F54
MAGHRFNPEKADKLINPDRKKIVDPERIITMLGLTESDKIVDLGAGNGFFTIPFAQTTRDTVYAVDIEQKMLELLKERANKASIENITYIQSDLENIKMEEDTVDKAFIAFVMHEIPNMTKALEEIKRIIKPGGKLLIVDWEAVESEMGPPLHERISSKEMENFLHSNGFQPTVKILHEAVYAVLTDVN